MLCWKPSHVQRTRKHGLEAPACAPAQRGKASSEWMQKHLPFPLPATAWLTLTLSCSPLALHPTAQDSSSSLLLTLATPVSIQAPHPNPSCQWSVSSSPQLPTRSPAAGSLPARSQVPPNLDPCPRHPHLTSSAPEICSLPSNSNPYPSGPVFTHSPSLPSL